MLSGKPQPSERVLASQALFELLGASFGGGEAPQEIIYVLHVGRPSLTLIERVPPIEETQPVWVGRTHRAFIGILCCELSRSTIGVGMRVAIIGAGIGGLTLGRALARAGIDATIHERRDRYARTGLGLLLLPNGLAALDAVGLGDVIRCLSNPIDLAVIRGADGHSVAQFPLEGHRGIARLDLLSQLELGVAQRALRWTETFRTFTHRADGITAQIGSREVTADLLVGADGVRSTVRRQIAPDWQLEQCPVSELVSVCEAPDLSALYDRTFIKHVQPEQRLAVGLVPAAHGKVVWFLQFDASDHRAVPDDPEGKRAFVRDLVGQWSDPVSQLLERTDFNGTHLWRTPAPGAPAPLVTGRVVLIGDAAHPFPTLTSQGANAAIADAVSLARHLSGASDIDDALAAFALERAPRIEAIRGGGERLVAAFMEGGSQTTLPLVH